MAKQKTGVGAQWLRDLQEKPLKPLYVLYGEEDFRRRTAVELLYKRLIDPALEDFNLTKLDGRGLDVRTIIEAVDTPPMMAEMRLILIRDYDLFKNREAIEPVIAELPEGVCLVFVYEQLECKPDTRTKFYKKLVEVGELAEFTRAEPTELATWIRYRFKQAGKKIGNAELTSLIERCGDGMTNLASEIDKLCAYCTDIVVTQEDIEHVTCRVAEAQVFALCDAITDRKLRYALHLLDDLEAARAEAIPTLSLIGTQMRRLYAARLVIDAGRGSKALMELTGLKYSFLAEKLMNGAQRVKLSALRRCMTRCSEADLALKSSKGAPYACLRELLVGLYEDMVQG
ncbi:MAG: DNA polymerase III subunit delta [Clostridia bacterium]|nr:DNA polymerase III subunit delta [Clostridia bacterium]